MKVWLLAFAICLVTSENLLAAESVRLRIQDRGQRLTAGFEHSIVTLIERLGAVVTTEPAQMQVDIEVSAVAILVFLEGGKVPSRIPLARPKQESAEEQARQIILAYVESRLPDSTSSTRSSSSSSRPTRSLQVEAGGASGVLDPAFGPQFGVSVGTVWWLSRSPQLGPWLQARHLFAGGAERSGVRFDLSETSVVAGLAAVVVQGRSWSVQARAGAGPRLSSTTAQSTGGFQARDDGAPLAGALAAGWLSFHWAFADRLGAVAAAGAEVDLSSVQFEVGGQRIGRASTLRPGFSLALSFEF